VGDNGVEVVENQTIIGRMSPSSESKNKPSQKQVFSSLTSCELHDFIPQKIELFITTSVTTSSPTYQIFFYLLFLTAVTVATIC
jgi:hypothetical protein